MSVMNVILVCETCGYKAEHAPRTARDVGNIATSILRRIEERRIADDAPFELACPKCTKVERNTLFETSPPWKMPPDFRERLWISFCRLVYKSSKQRGWRFDSQGQREDF
jgi:hypothetical protein